MKWASLVIAVVFAVLLSAGLRACGPGGSGILDQLELSDGSEYLLTQRWNGFVEPYTVSFYFKLGGGQWGWCYIEHEDTRWFHAELLHDADTNSVKIYRDGALRAELFLDRQVFALYGANTQQRREVDAPQDLRFPEDWPKN